MNNYFVTLLLGLTFLSGCATNQRRPMTFISGSNISFQLIENSIPNMYKRKSNFAFINYGDSIAIGNDYKSVQFTTEDDWYSKRFTSYIVTDTGKSLADLVTLDFYKQKLSNLHVYRRGKTNVDSLIRATEKFFNKKFEIEFSNYSNDHDSSDYKKFKGEWARESGYFMKGKILVRYSRDNIYDEISLLIFNEKVEIPSWCGFRTPWWRYLTFWRHW
jgi:hypothetical protein